MTQAFSAVRLQDSPDVEVSKQRLQNCCYNYAQGHKGKYLVINTQEITEEKSKVFLKEPKWKFYSWKIT